MFGGLGSLLRVGRFASSGGGRRADQHGQVVEIEMARDELAARERDHAPDVHGQVAGHVRVADATAEIAVGDDRVVALEQPAQRIRRRFRHRKVEQRVEVGEVLSGDIRAQLKMPEVDRRRQRTAHVRVRGAGT